MATRFTDDFFHNTDGSDFIVRKRIPVAAQILVIFAVAFAAIYGTAHTMNTNGSTTLFLVTLIFTLGGLTWFTVFTSASLRDLVLATEFQNALLASAAQLSTRFCLITKRDGSIVYIDQGFQKTFPKFMNSNDRNIDGLFDVSGVTREAISKIILMLQHGQSDRVLLSIRDSEGQSIPTMLTVDLLPRPRGYFLMRGRDYVEKRGEEASGAGANLSSAVEQLLGMLEDGILVTTNGGVIIYANPILELWLGFQVGELRSHAIKSGKIIYQYGSHEANRPVNTDFSGDVVMQRKDRSLVTMQIRQIVSGKPAAISAIISGGTLRSL